MSVDVCAYGYVTREWEVFPDGTSREITAGPPYFLAAALASLGDRVRVVTRVSREDEHILDELRRLGVDVVNLGTMRSMKSRIIYRESGERELEVLSLARPFGLQDLDFCIRVSPRYIYLGPLTTQDFDLDFIRRARSRAQVVLDVQGFTRKVVGRRVVYVDWVWKLDAAPYVSILKLDDREGELLTGSREPEEIVSRLHEMGFGEVLLTTSWGVYASLRNRHIYRAPYRVRRVVGRTGRGDTATAAYLHARLRGWEPARAVVFAAAATSLKLMEVGPLKKSEAEVLRFLEEEYSQGP